MTSKMPENRDTDPRDRDEIERRKDILVQRLIEYLKEFEEKDLANVKEPDFHRAARENRVDIACLLYKRGDDVNARNEEYATALHLAARNDSIDMGRLLIKAGADVNAIDINGHTPLYFAAVRQSPNFATMLLAKGARTSGVDMHWWSQPITQTEREEEFEERLREAEDYASLHQPNIQELTPLGMRDVDIDWGSIDYERRT